MTYARRAFCFFVLYWLMWQSSSLIELSPHVSALSPAPALAIAFLAFFGFAYLPVYLIAVIMSSLPQLPFWNFSVLEWGMALQGFVVYGTTGIFINKVCRYCYPVRTLKHIARFLTMAFLSSLLSAVLSIHVLQQFSTAVDEPTQHLFFSIWIGDAGGIIIMGPLMFILMNNAQKDQVLTRFKKQLNEIINDLDLGILFVLFSVQILFYGISFSAHITDFEYLCLLPIAIGAAKMGFLRGYIAALMSSMALIILAQIIGLGDYPALDLQFMFLISTIIAMLVGIESDATLKAENKAENFYSKSIHDDLTGLPNRAYFFETLQAFSALCVREKRVGHLLYIDVDAFKEINDTLGHLAGDCALKTISETLKKHQRQGDTVCRIGGDEFAIILTSTHSEQDANLVRQKILDRVAAARCLDYPTVSLRISIGLQEITSVFEGKIDDLLHLADLKMYEHKNLKKTALKVP